MSAAADGIRKARRWLSESALPLWTTRGFDEAAGTFVEALSLSGAPLEGPRRAMVQARQMYSLRVAARLGLFPHERAGALIARAARAMIERWGLPSGAFVKSIDASGRPADATPDLYTQAFAIFGLAQAYAFSKDPALKLRALAVVDYLARERRAEGGGYTELEKGAPLLRSNPHMHLYEAFLAWMELDADARWKTPADEVCDLCLQRFVDAGSGCLAERFDGTWTPERGGPNGFLFEPGHHFEWAWLMNAHQRLSGRGLARRALALYEKAQRHGLSADGFAFDEVWSDGTIKTRSSRFWPQAERTKAALRLGAQAGRAERASFARDADQAFGALFRFLETPTPGLWSDQRLADGSFTQAPARASALYHIIAALDEYIGLRPSFS